MRILTTVFVFLFTLCAVVGTLPAQDADLETYAVIKSVIPLPGQYCRYYIDYNTGEILNTDCPTAEVITLVTIPPGVDEETAEALVASYKIDHWKTVHAYAAEITAPGIDPDACADQLVRVQTPVTGQQMKVQRNWYYYYMLLDAPVSLRIIYRPVLDTALHHIMMISPTGIESFTRAE